MLRYLLRDPQLTSLTYELANRDELLSFAARALGHDHSSIAKYAAETEHHGDLRHPLGNRLLWYLAVRATKPGLVIQAGIGDGLGSLILLLALERNAEEGQRGRLLSFDRSDNSGWLVAERLHDHWQCVPGSAANDLEHALHGLRAGMLVQDTTADAETRRAEIETVLRHRDDRLVIIDERAAGADALRSAAAGEGVREERFLGRSVHHVHPGHCTSLAVFADAARDSHV